MTARPGFLVLRFLRSDPSPIIRWPFAAAAFVAVVIATRRAGLARLAARRIARGDFLYGLRLGNWLVHRTSGLGAADRAFDFTEAASGDDLEALARFLDAHAGADGAALAADQLLIAARRGHAALAAGDEAAFLAALAAFAAAADTVLAMAPGQEVAGKAGGSGAASPARPRPAMASADADAALADFAAVWARALAPRRWYIISGTLLGAVREGGWLKHDVDIDVGVDAGEYEPGSLKRAFRASRAFVVRGAPPALAIRRGADGRHRLETAAGVVKLMHRSGIPVDLFIHHREGDVSWHGSTINRWENSAFELAEYQLAGLTVLGPADADRYLTENYGQWRTPVRTFSALTGTPNIRVARNMVSVAMFLRRYATHRRSGSPEAARIRALLRAAGVIRAEDGGAGANGGGDRFDATFFDG